MFTNLWGIYLHKGSQWDIVNYLDNNNILEDSDEALAD